MRLHSYRACTQISNPSLFYHVVQRFHDLHAVHITVQPVDLEYIDIGTKSLDAGFNGIKDVLARQAHFVHHGSIIEPHVGNRVIHFVRRNAEITLAQNDEIAARDLEPFNRLGNDLFGAAMGVYIGL